ncbi:hypothetical protein SAMN04489712_10958 [Thermomonospora echinospora]|uniref:Uncharacterized protein n=1 Tax=Thermomonospora echinospora TaxID=1992 RepID=A0A1H6C868_9ACTN|nr:hypothetical protein [Thermomonospora echinospora]SEG69180.1 hypothetical protein SAMN04489712_10958 [Thermomonospora echinospora]
MLYDYFAAADDGEAASVLGRRGGPDGSGFDSVVTKGIDPAVHMGTLEELLTGRPLREVFADPRSARPVGPVPRAGEPGVVTLTDSLARALATVDGAMIAETAVHWSESEEFHGEADPLDLAEFLMDLAEVARRAAGRGHRLYCRSAP